MGDSAGLKPVVKHRGVTRRSLLVGIIVAVLNAYWVQYVEALQRSALPMNMSLVMSAVFTVVILSLLNLLLQRVAPRYAFHHSELLLIYSMACLGAAGASQDFNNHLLPTITWSFWLANPANKWDALFNDDLPHWLTVRDPQVLRGFYEGGTTLYRPEFLSAWGIPLAMWTAFALALVIVMICINVLIRKQWLDSEHLDCPLVRVPVEISAPRGRLFTNKLFWLGFALTAALDTWNSFALAYPALPEVSINCVNMTGSIQGRPWNAVGFMPRAFYPMVIGIGYLMPSDFLFSCWFFYLFWKGEAVLGAAFGLDQIRDFPFANFQSFGAYVLFALYGLWLGRRHLRQLYDTLIESSSRLSDEEEPLRYRAAILGVLAGLLFLLWFSVKMGMQLWVAMAFFLLYFVLALAVTRMRAQFGAPVHDLAYTGASPIIATIIGTRHLPKHDLIGLTLYHWFSYTYRSFPMPAQIEAFKMQDRTADTRIGVVQALTLSVVLGFVTGTWANLDYNHRLGALAAGGIENLSFRFATLSSWLTAPEGTRWGPVVAIWIGAGLAFFLQTMRLRFVHWPFHPLGFALSAGHMMNVVWMQLLIAWLIKTAVTKYGGHKVYRLLTPFFLGAILGQCVVGCIASTIGLVLHTRLYKFLSMQEGAV